VERVAGTRARRASRAKVVVKLFMVNLSFWSAGKRPAPYKERCCTPREAVRLRGSYVRRRTITRMKRLAPKPPERRLIREGKVRKELWLDPETLRLAQKILGTATERETVEAALDMIAFRRELLDGTRVLSELQIDSIR
jgi:hypothetical protein